MINRSQLNRRIWPALAIAVSLFSFSASAQTYPISGVWVAMDHSRFPEFEGRSVSGSENVRC